MIMKKLNLVCSHRGGAHRHFSPDPDAWVGMDCGTPLRGTGRACRSKLKLIATSSRGTSRSRRKRGDK
jgi:hypothetical protein